MTDWQVRLHGQRVDLENLSRCSPSDWSIVEVEENFYLKSPAFVSLTKANEVRETAIDILDKINGLAKLSFADFQRVEVDVVTEIAENGKRRHQIIHLATLHLRSKLHSVTVGSGGAMDIPRQPTLIETAFPVAAGDANIAEALRIWGTLENNWINLYKIFEIVRDDVGGHKKLSEAGWVHSHDISRFTGTAQRSELIGDEARHARMKGNPPSDPMSFSEAQALIGIVLANWVKSKL